MKRQLLVQPDGNYAIFCHTTDEFVGIDLSKDEAVVLLAFEHGLLKIQRIFEYASPSEWPVLIQSLLDCNEDGDRQKELDKISHLMGKAADPCIHDGCHSKCIQYGCEHERVWAHPCDRDENGMYECCYEGKSLNI